MTQPTTTAMPHVADVTSYEGNQMTIPFNEIREPGTYYFHTTGWIFRVPPECLSPGHSPVLNIHGNDQCYVTKITDNPWIPVGKAREICSNWDFMVNF